MKTSVQRFILFITIIMVNGLLQPIQAQNHRKEGDKAWAAGRYKTAVNKYGLVESLKSDKKLLARRGEGFFKLNRLDKAILHFTQSKKLGNKDPELFWMMAQCKHHMEDYDEAAYFYKAYLKQVGEKNPKGKKALRELKNCSYAALNKENEEVAYVRNFGSEINTYYDEIYPIQSPRYGNVYYFTSNRNLKDMDVYSYELNAKGEWQKNKDFESTINSMDDQYGMDVSTNGLSMLYATAPKEKPVTKIHVSTYDAEGTQHFINLPDYIIDGAMDVQIIDYNSIAFASKELGGYGGYDIFTINYENGIWSDPINEGLPINSEYDERSPCYATTGDYLYYSSNRPYCYGGFDIYYYNKLSIGKEPSNLGLPINGPGNDLQFRMNQDGQTAIMSSDRKTGEGAYDLYLVYMNESKPMPARGMEQLSYVRDYFKKLFPDSEPIVVSEEKTQSHLEKLKERLDIEAETAEPLDDMEDDPIVETGNSDEIETELIDEEPELPSKTKSVIGTINDSESSNEVESIVEEVVLVQAEPVKTEEDSDKVSAVLESEMSPEQDKPKEEERNNSGRSDAEITTTALPEKDSGESPLSNLQASNVSEELAPQVKPISGERINYALLYQDRHDLMNEVNKAKLERLHQYLKNNPEHHLHIIAHTDHLEPGLPEFMQYNTLKRANLISRFLLEKNIPSQRISIESVCANYPLARPEVSGVVNEEFLAYNKRVEFEIMDEDGIVLASHDISKARIPGYALDTKYELFSQVREELYYSVEIATSKHIFKNAILRLYDNIYVRKSAALADNKYYIGIFSTFKEAKELQAELEASSAPYAEIKVFYNGMPIRSENIDDLSRDYPDLKSFLEAGLGK